MYNKVDTNMNFVDREKETEKFWRENDIFKKSMENRKEGETYTFYDGPPTANGKPHIGHVETRTIKDMIPRFQTMKGKYVPRKAGWDTHGLPVEIEVEKLLGLDGKDQIEAYGLEPFIKKCKESVWKYKGMWEDFSNTVGFWADMDNPYVTYDDNFIESEWWALKEIWNKGLLYKGFKIVPYCPRCGTPLSAQEVAQGYKLVKEKSAVVRFKVVDEDAYFLAWTTTPWTLPSNVALCVNPNDTYIKVKAVDGYTYYLAEALADKVLSPLLSKEDKEAGKKAYEVLETYKGQDLERKEYEPLYACAKELADKQGKKGFFVTCDTYVTMSDGTGIVHIAPAFGEDDANVGRNYDLPFVQFVNGKGELTEETPFAGCGQAVAFLPLFEVYRSRFRAVGRGAARVVTAAAEIVRFVGRSGQDAIGVDVIIAFRTVGDIDFWIIVVNGNPRIGDQLFFDREFCFIRTTTVTKINAAVYFAASLVVRDLRVTADPDIRLISVANVYTAAVVCCAVVGDSTAVHDKAAVCAVVTHTTAVAIYMVAGDGAAVHGKGAESTHLHSRAAPAFRMGDGALAIAVGDDERSPVSSTGAVQLDRRTGTCHGDAVTVEADVDASCIVTYHFTSLANRNIFSQIIIYISCGGQRHFAAAIRRPWFPCSRTVRMRASVHVVCTAKAVVVVCLCLCRLHLRGQHTQRRQYQCQQAHQ